MVRQYFLVVSELLENGSTSAELISAAQRLRKGVERLKFSTPVTHVYNPLAYAWGGHELYLQKFGNGPKRIVFLGMNPGPFGMVQTEIGLGLNARLRSRSWSIQNGR